MSILFPTGRKVSDRKFHESGVRGRFEPNLRMVRGTINTTTPTIVEGVGFTVAKNGTGDVTITFDPLFASAPSVTGTSVIVANGTWIYLSGNPTTSTARIVRTIAAAAEDGIFHFVAVGPIT